MKLMNADNSFNLDVNFKSSKFEIKNPSGSTTGTFANKTYSLMIFQKDCFVP
jgi:hypothetical protein